VKIHKERVMHYLLPWAIWCNYLPQNFSRSQSSMEFWVENIFHTEGRLCFFSTPDYATWTLQWQLLIFNKENCVNGNKSCYMLSNYITMQCAILMNERNLLDTLLYNHLRNRKGFWSWHNSTLLSCLSRGTCNGFTHQKYLVMLHVLCIALVTKQLCNVIKIVSFWQ